MKEKIEIRTIDVGRVVYKATMDNGKVFKRTINGFISTSNGVYGYMQIYQAKNFGPKLAGEWKTWTTDCGKSINSKYVVSVAIFKKESLLYSLVKQTKESWWSGTDTSYFKEKVEIK